MELVSQKLHYTAVGGRKILSDTFRGPELITINQAIVYRRKQKSGKYIPF
jgi:hypothetical protein